MTEVHPCKPGCTTRRAGDERPVLVDDLTKAELLDEYALVVYRLENAERYVDVVSREALELRHIPRWVRWVFQLSPIRWLGGWR